MKKVFTYLTVAGAALFAASCDPNNAPVFDDADAFVGFSSTRVTVSESRVKKSGEMTAMGDTVFIPVTLGSVAGLEGSATYTIVPDTTKLDSVKKFVPEEGVHYELVDNDGTGTLRFDADHRTRYIGVAGKLFDEYTGDLSFKITVKASDGLKTSALNVCTVVISDVNHPLSFILGEYTATTTGWYYSAYGQSESWPMTIYKDKEDDHKIWFDNIFNCSGWAAEDTRFYGNVNEDKTEISVPLGQQAEYMYDSDHGVYLYGHTPSWAAADDLLDSGSLQIQIKDNDGAVSLVFDPTMGLSFWIGEYPDNALGYTGAVDPEITAVKL